MRTRGRYLIVYLLLGFAAWFLHTHETVAVPVNKPLTDIPVQFEGWTMAGQSRFSPDAGKRCQRRRPVPRTGFT